jgi:hypothetical protein
MACRRTQGGQDVFNECDKASTVGSRGNPPRPVRYFHRAWGPKALRHLRWAVCWDSSRNESALSSLVYSLIDRIDDRTRQIPGRAVKEDLSLLQPDNTIGIFPR